MTEDQMKSLKPGDMVRHKHSSQAYKVVENTGDSILIVRASTLTNPHEWDEVDKSGRVIST